MISSPVRTRDRAIPRASILCVCAVLGACGGGGGSSPDASPPVETLDPEPNGAPVDTADGRLTCLGNNQPDPPDTTVLELTGYLRTMADPGADAEPPAATIEVFTASGTSLGQGFADPTKDGRIAVTVAIPEAGFTGYAVATQDGYLDYRFQTNRPVTHPEANGWAWLVTAAEVDAFASALGVTVAADRGILTGSIHDCDNFGVQSAVIQVDGSSDGVAYTDVFEPATGRTFTAANGRFVVPNVAPGAATVKAYGRLSAGGPLTLLASIETTIVAGTVTAVALQPRVANE